MVMFRHVLVKVTLLIPKGWRAIGRSLSADDYLCFFVTNDNQFDFKKDLSDSHSSYSVRCFVNKDTGSSTVSICSLDLSKMFNKVDHFALFSKLLVRNFPNLLLKLDGHWFSLASTCIKRGGHVTNFFIYHCQRQTGLCAVSLFICNICVRRC